ncbi:MAG: molybdopterin-dependent oxidoreductase [Gammaproteobacteria bacterium]|nr:MAG: molybdopterin-dependent oxidoreductase [Gammaproteobacteria bacterium]
MRISRRGFLQVSAAVASALGYTRKASAMEVALGDQSYNFIKRQSRTRVFSCSPLPLHDNPVEAWIEDDPDVMNLLTGKPGKRVVEISGVTESNRSRGRVSAADVSSWLQLTDGDRLMQPLKRVGARGSGKWQPITWQQALEEIAVAVNNSPPEAVALLRGKDTSAGAWDRFLHTIGSNTVIELDDAANRRAALQTVWGEGDSVPDLAHSHYILNFGTNFFVSYPDYAAEALDARMYRRARIVTFDPRCSKTAGLSDEWVQVRPGTDGVVALAMTRYLLKKGWADEAAIERLSNLSAARLAQELEPYTLEYAAEISGVPALTIRRIAREFAESQRGCTLTGAGTSGHTNGYDTERALMLLPLVVGALEVRGGNCLPRRLYLGGIEPAPPLPGNENPVRNPYQFPFEAGQQYPVNVLFGYNTNPAFAAPSAALWRRTLSDQSRVGLFVGIGTFRNETWELADIILPESHWLERNEPVQGEGSLLPWVGLRQRVVDPPGQVRELREILRDIIHTTGDSEQARYWQFSDSKEWLGQQLSGVAGLTEDGGWEALAKHSGVWPTYGYLDPELRRIVDEQGEEVLPEYGRPVMLDLDPFPHWKAARDSVTGEGELTLLVHASDYHAGDASSNNKVMVETTLANHLQINTSTAQGLGISDGDLVRVSSKAGFLVTRARVTQSIRPEVVAMHRDGGHWSIGGVASGKAGPEHEEAPVNLDLDIAHNLWWTDLGVQPMDLIIPEFDTQGGGTASATPVTVKRAEDGDAYGTVNVDTSVLLAVQRSVAMPEGS